MKGTGVVYRKSVPVEVDRWWMPKVVLRAILVVVIGVVLVCRFRHLTFVSMALRWYGISREFLNRCAEVYPEFVRMDLYFVLLGVAAALLWFVVPGRQRVGGRF